MPYQVYYGEGCDGAIPDHLCSDCGEKEGARVRGGFFVRNDFVFEDMTNPLEWTAGIQSKQIIMLPRLQGTFDGGAENEVDGYGDVQSELAGFTHTVNFKDPDYKLNAKFYQAIKNSRNWRFGFRTATQGHMSDVAVSIIPKNPVAANTTDNVVWDVTAKWTSQDIVEPFDIPLSIFTCFQQYD